MSDMGTLRNRGRNTGRLYQRWRIGMRVCAESVPPGSGTGEPRDHERRHGQREKRLAARLRSLTIAGEPTGVGHPGSGALHYPASGEHRNACGQCHLTSILPGFSGNMPRCQARRADQILASSGAVFLYMSYSD